MKEGDDAGWNTADSWPPLTLDPLRSSGPQAPSAMPKKTLYLTGLFPRPSLETPRGPSFVVGRGAAGSPSLFLSELGEIMVGAQGQCPAVIPVSPVSSPWSTGLEVGPPHLPYPAGVCTCCRGGSGDVGM